MDSESRIEPAVSDAFASLTDQVLDIASRAGAERPQPANAPRSAGPSGPAAALGGVSVTGEQPDVLSKAERTRLVADSKKLAVAALVLGAVVAVLLIVIDALIDDSHVSGAWAILPSGLFLVSVMFWLVAYLTVMGFGKVSIGLELGEGGAEPATGGGDGKGQAAKKAAKRADGGW